MKAACNGVLNLSTLDGWWCEGYDPEVGWGIGSGEEYSDPALQDQLESGALYETLEQEVVPMFYDRGRDGLPRRWIARMKRSMSQLAVYFNTSRMVADYVDRYYLQAGAKFADLAGDGQGRAKALAAWRARVRQNWSGLRIEEVSSNVEPALHVGQSLQVTARVRLGRLSPEDIQVQCYHGDFVGEDRVEDGVFTRMRSEGVQDGVALYRGEAPCHRSGRRGFAVRVLPDHDDLVHPFDPGMVIWG